MLKGTVAGIRLALIGVKISIVSEHYAEAFQARARVRQARYPGCSISRSALFHGCVSVWLSSQVRNLPYEMLCPGHLACFILVLDQWGTLHCWRMRCVKQILTHRSLIAEF